MEINHSILINSSKEVLWKWIGYPENAKIWMESVSETEYIHRTPNMIGTTFRETVADEGGELEMDGVVKDYQENERLVFQLTSQIHEVIVEYNIIENRDALRLDVITSIRWKFPMNILSVFAGSKIKKQIYESSAREFQKLKELCENDK